MPIIPLIISKIANIFSRFIGRIDNDFDLSIFSSLFPLLLFRSRFVADLSGAASERSRRSIRSHEVSDSRFGKLRIGGKHVLFSPPEKCFRVSVNWRENQSCEYPRMNISRTADTNSRTISRQGRRDSKRISRTDIRTSSDILGRYISPRINSLGCFLLSSRDISSRMTGFGAILSEISSRNILSRIAQFGIIILPLLRHPLKDKSIRSDTRRMSYRFRAIFLSLAAFSSNLLSRTIRFGAIISSTQ